MSTRAKMSDEQKKIAEEANRAGLIIYLPKPSAERAKRPKKIGQAPRKPKKPIAEEDWLNKKGIKIDEWSKLIADTKDPKKSSKARVEARDALSAKRDKLRELLVADGKKCGENEIAYLVSSGNNKNKVFCRKKPKKIVRAKCNATDKEMVKSMALEAKAFKNTGLQNSKGEDIIIPFYQCRKKILAPPARAEGIYTTKRITKNTPANKIVDAIQMKYADEIKSGDLILDKDEAGNVQYSIINGKVRVKAVNVRKMDANDPMIARIEKFISNPIVAIVNKEARPFITSALKQLKDSEAYQKLDDSDLKAQARKAVTREVLSKIVRSKPDYEKWVKEGTLSKNSEIRKYIEANKVAPIGLDELQRVATTETNAVTRAKDTVQKAELKRTKDIMDLLKLKELDKYTK